MDHHPTKIMILGRWKSEAIMDYIRPQVLEWMNLMSQDMVAYIYISSIESWWILRLLGGYVEIWKLEVD
jgi:hypothetical protein